MNIIRYGGPMARTRKVGSPIGYSGSAGLTGFVSVWATTGTFETITIPCQNVGTFNAVIDWGDGTPTSTITAYNDADLAHVYADIDDHTITITGTFPNIYFNNGGDKGKIKKVTSLGTVGWTRLNGAFRGCTNLTEFTVGTTDISGVTDMTTMFRNCSGLTSLDLSSLDVSSLTTTYQMFYFCTGLTSLNLSGFVTTASLNTVYQMFNGCSGLTSLDVSSFNTSGVTTLQQMFQGCSGLTSVVGVEDFNITGLNSTGSLTSFLTGGKMTTAQYDALLVKWEAQASGIPAMTPSFGTSTYTGGGAAATARQDLIDIDGWSISDGGIAP